MQVLREFESLTLRQLGTMAESGLRQLLAKESTYIIWRPEVQILLVPPTEFDGVWRSLVNAHV